MTCSSRSIPSFASSLLLGLLLAAPLFAAGAEPEIPTHAVESAIAAAVRARVGEAIQVSVSDIVGVRLIAAPPVLVAVPEPSARIGVPARFVLIDGRGGETRARVGEATATIHAEYQAVRTVRDVARGVRITAADVALQSTDLDGRPMRRLPSLEEAIDARVTRDLAAGALVTANDIAIAPLVQIGQPVRAHVHVDGVEVTATVTALENGGRDDTVRVMYEDNHRVLRARVIDKGEVEVVDVR